MNKKRLLKLADLLEADAKNKHGIKFNLDNWAADGDGDARAFYDVDVIPVNCNTQACAVGLACISGAFKRSGLGYDIAYSGALVPSFEGLQQWDAVQSFFGLTTDEAGLLFSSDKYPTKKTKGAAAERYVAKRIRDFVAGKVAA